MATDFEEQYTEVCGWRGNYVRINLKAVKEGKISAAELALAFISSGKNVNSEDLHSWKAEWQSIESIVRELYPTLNNFEQDSEAIDSMLESGGYVVHHSKIYNQTYNPHYRIVSREEYNRLKDKLK